MSGLLGPDGLSERAQLGLGISAVVASVAVPALAGNPYWSHTFHLVNLYIAVAVLQNMLLADAGQVSFGQGAVFGAAAYTVGIASSLHGASFPVAAAFGLLAALALGSLYALPALRVQGYYLGFVTLSVAMVFPELLVSFNDYTNGINGITRAVPALNVPLVGGLTPLSLLVIALTSATLAAHAALRHTRMGRHMRVAAVSPEAALALGFSPGHVRSAAFVIAAFGTALAGVLYVPVVGFLSPSAFHVELSIFFFFSVIVGGRGRLLGPIVGVWILYLVPNVLMVDLVNYRLIGYGVVALVIMLLFPDGLVGSIENRLRRRMQQPGGADVGVRSIMAVTAVGRAKGGPAGTAPDATPVVRVDAARKAYDHVIALDDVTLAVARGTIHGLVGPNGSGKTTLLNAISGFARIDRGSVRILDHDTTRRPAWRTARLGVGRTFQTPRVFDDLSISENLQIGADYGRDRHRADRLFAALRDVEPRWRVQRPDFLPHAQRRLLEVLRVIAMDCDVLLLDEPAAGLSPEERRDFATLLSHLRDALGKTIILVEHDLDLVWRVADRITVLEAGAIIAEGAPDRIVSDPKVRALFTGSAMLDVRNLHSGYGRAPVLHDISIAVHPGEVVLVLGGNGAGKSTLMRSIAGFIKPTRGTVLLDGRDITGQSPEVNARQGLRLILDGHRVFPELSVADNIRLGAAIRPDPGDFESLAGEVLDFFPILRAKLRSAARDLSGGQQQMLALAQAFVARPAVLLCDEPSLGIAQALIPPILEFLRNWARQGVAVLIVEQQIDVALSIADRAVVIERGAITLSGTAEELKRDRRVQDIYLGLDAADRAT